MLFIRSLLKKMLLITQQETSVRYWFLSIKLLQVDTNIDDYFCIYLLLACKWYEQGFKLRSRYRSQTRSIFVIIDFEENYGQMRLLYLNHDIDPVVVVATSRIMMSQSRSQSHTFLKPCVSVWLWHIYAYYFFLFNGF